MTARTSGNCRSANAGAGGGGHLPVVPHWPGVADGRTVRALQAIQGGKAVFLRWTIAVAVLVAGTAAAAAQTTTEAWRLSGFKIPESAILDKANNRLIVSNIGAFGEPDG